MEKYTVDLDKVLNDFEYNELALEQDSFNLLATTSSAMQAVPPPYASTNRLKPTAGPTKHSINTVFKSLDDYINSDIPIVPACKPTEDNNNISRVVPAESNLLVDISSLQDEEVVLRNPAYNLVQRSDNNITEGLNLQISSQEDIVFNKKTVLEDVDVDNSDSESTESIYLDMSGGGKNAAPSEAPKIIEEDKTELPKPVGFNNTLDIDDSELSQYLEDLEKELDVSKEDFKNNSIELQRKFVENEVKVVGDFKLEVEEDKAKERRRDSMQGRPNSLDIVNNLVPTRECINLIGKGMQE